MTPAAPRQQRRAGPWRWLVAVAFAMSGWGSAHAIETLRVLAWPGYADADITVVPAFLRR